MEEVKIKPTSFAGWDCVKITNGALELIATTEIGPRIVKFGFVDDKNEFGLREGQLGQTGGDEWNMYGGHRLWHSPEKERTYIPDNESIETEEKEKGVKLIQPIEKETQIQKIIDIEMEPSDKIVEVKHTLANRGNSPIELAPWPLTVMDSGGKAIIPFSRGDSDGLLPDRSITLWPYSKMNDPRVKFEDEFIFLQQEPGKEFSFKLGALVKDEWTSYVNEGHAFIKYFSYEEEEEYPDFGCTVEAYTDDFMLELETLGPLKNIDAGESIEHIETWKLAKIEGTIEDKEDVSKYLIPKI